jgi:alginate production protein
LSPELFEFGGHIELVYERLQNFDLDSGNGDDLDLLPVELELGVLFSPNDHFEAYLQSKLTRTLVLRDDGEDEVRDSELLVEEAYVIVTEPDWGLSLQVGRQSFEDRRQWLYDAELDAVRALYRAQNLAVELSASREGLVDKDLLNSEEEESIDNYTLYGTYELGEHVTIGAYGILRDPGGRDRPVFLGLQSFGTLGERLSYWLDAAHVRGQEDGSDLRGYGFDVLGSYRLNAPLSPHVILGYAFGSGDSDPDDDRDGAFRQTGLQGNETEVGGLTPFSYYGEAFDPELSNMSIFTFGLGARTRPRRSCGIPRSTPSLPGRAGGWAARSTSCSVSRRSAISGSGGFSATLCPAAPSRPAPTTRSSFVSRPSMNSEAVLSGLWPAASVPAQAWFGGEIRDQGMRATC